MYPLAALGVRPEELLAVFVPGRPLSPEEAVIPPLGRRPKRGPGRSRKQTEAVEQLDATAESKKGEGDSEAARGPAEKPARKKRKE